MAKKDYEYIIAGSGVAGITVAKNILESDPSASILMLEAGPEIKAKDRRFWWNYVTNAKTPYSFTYDQKWENKSVGNTNYLSEGVRVKAYGGSTMHWGAWCLRFKEEDFNLFTNTGEGADWPIKYDDLEPYYGLAENYLSVCGDDSENWTRRSTPYPAPPFEWSEPDGEVIKAFRNLGIKPGKMPIARYRKCMTTGTCKYCPLGSRFNAQYVLDELRENPNYVNFKIQTNSPVTKVIASSKKQVDGIEYLDTISGESKVVFGDSVIVCTGAYEVPKLLMNSTSQYWHHGIGNDYDLLGRFVISHSMLMATGTSPSNPKGWYQEYDFPTLMSRTYDTEKDQKHGKILLFKNRVLPNTDIAQLMIDGLTKPEIDQKVNGPMSFQLQAFMEEKGRFHNRLKAAPGKDRFGLPKTVIDFNRTEQDAKDAQINLDRMSEVLLEMGLKIEEKPYVQDPGGHHTTGTCRMGQTEEDSVLDKDLKVHGMNNLYVCSNGAFPTGSAVNPTLTLTALAIRLSEHLTSKRGKTSVPKKSKKTAPKKGKA